METMTRERLHRLVDILPAGELPVAGRYLEFLAGFGHPLVRVLFTAPEADEPLSAGDRKALDEGRRALDAGDTVSDRELRDLSGLPPSGSPSVLP